jgi:hypothetical protein
MITVRKVHPSGATEVSAVVLDTKTRAVWLERQAYFGYSKQEAKTMFKRYLSEQGFGLVND